MTRKLWFRNNKLLVDALGRPAVCETCPCDTGTGTPGYGDCFGVSGGFSSSLYYAMSPPNHPCYTSGGSESIALKRHLTYHGIPFPFPLTLLGPTATYLIGYYQYEFNVNYDPTAGGGVGAPIDPLLDYAYVLIEFNPYQDGGSRECFVLVDMRFVSSGLVGYTGEDKFLINSPSAPTAQGVPNPSYLGLTPLYAVPPSTTINGGTIYDYDVPPTITPTVPGSLTATVRIYSSAGVLDIDPSVQYLNQDYTLSFSYGTYWQEKVISGVAIPYDYQNGFIMQFSFSPYHPFGVGYACALIEDTADSSLASTTNTRTFLETSFTSSPYVWTGRQSLGGTAYIEAVVSG